MCSLFSVRVTILAAVLWISTMQVTLRLQPTGSVVQGGVNVLITAISLHGKGSWFVCWCECVN